MKTFPPLPFYCPEGTGRPNGQPLYTRFMGATAFYIPFIQGGQFRAAKGPRIYLNDPNKGITKRLNVKCWDNLAAFNDKHYQE